MTSQLEPIPNSRIIGYVYGEGSKLGGARVTCNGRSTTTLFDGSYRFGNLAPGTYTLVANLKGFRSQTKTVVVKENETVTVEFHLTKAVGVSKICGYVYDAETGKPITAGTMILILPVANRYVPICADGYYEFDKLSGDKYDIWASPEGYLEEKAVVSVGEGEIKTQNFYCKPKMEEVPWG